MNKTLTTVCLLAALRFASGCVGPNLTNDSIDCEFNHTTKILDSSESESSDILNVSVGRDSVGRSFQTATLLFGSSDFVYGSTGITLVINGVPQVTTAWNGRLLGLGRPTEIADDMVRHDFCVNSASFWQVPVGFGTISEYQTATSDSGFSTVGHPLTEGQEIHIRLDVCRGEQCFQGATRTYKIHLLP